MTLDNTCIFCRIIRGEVPSFRVFEDDRSLAFMDINPANPGHVLVIPKVHAESLFSLDEPWVTALLGRLALEASSAAGGAGSAGGVRSLRNEHRPGQRRGGRAVGAALPLARPAARQGRRPADELAAAAR